MMEGTSQTAHHATKEYWMTFLSDAGLDEKVSAEYAVSFVENEMGPELVGELSHGLLIMLGIKKVGHRMKILHFKGILDETGGHPTPLLRLHNQAHAKKKKRTRTKSHEPKSARKKNFVHEDASSSSDYSPDTVRREEVVIEQKESDKDQDGDQQQQSIQESEGGEEKTKKVPVLTLKHSNSMPSLIVDGNQSPTAEPRKPKGLVSVGSSPALAIPKRSNSVGSSGPSSESEDSIPLTPKMSEFHPYVEIDVSPRVLGGEGTASTEAIDRGSPAVNKFRLWTECTVPTHHDTQESGASTSRFYDQMSEGAKKAVVIGRAGRAGSDDESMMGDLTEIKYYFNLDSEKRYEHLPAPITQASFSVAVSATMKLQLDTFVVFHLNDTGEFEPLKKTHILESHETYYVIESDKLQQKILVKLKSRLKNEKVILDSVNTPMEVDFVPPKHLYMAENGKIGLCMAPGRKKKKKRHIWQRDLGQDLDRLQQVYGCNVLVTLVREQELQALKITELFDELKKRNIGSLFLPIKDKWIPKSTPDLIALVKKIIVCLKQGKTVVVHCNGGKGRSATVIVATLIAMGRSITDSIRIIQQTRKGTIRNPLQQAYLRRFRKEWNENLKRSRLLKDLKLSDVDEANISGMEDDSDLDTESDYESDDEHDGSSGVDADDEDQNKKLLHRFEKRIESYEKKIEKRERALAKDRERLEFYREQFKKVAERKGRVQAPLKRSKSARGMKDSTTPLKASIAKSSEKKEKDKEDKKLKDGLDGSKEKKENNNNIHNSNSQKQEDRKLKESEASKEKKEERKEKEREDKKEKKEGEKSVEH